VEKQNQVGRRDFFRVLAAGAAITLATGGPLAREALADSDRNSEKRKARYRETEEVKTFYRVNRYPPDGGTSANSQGRKLLSP